ncbi:MAG: glutamine-hydrolyzing GMP synthase [Deltaproteobacteria bacterium]|nr:glutamine-hydrolyzing GMP synthase [Deltaproteobacteria bacterium]
MKELVAVLDFGSQYAQLIARRIRELGVYSEIVHHGVTRDELIEMNPKALILSGGPASVLDPEHPTMDERILDLNVPIFGICYGMQLLALLLSGTVDKGRSGEYGPARLDVADDTSIFNGLAQQLDVWMSHGDHVTIVPDGYKMLAQTATCSVASMGNDTKKIYGVQFHPEVVHTLQGMDMLRNFLYRVAGCRGGWTMTKFIEESIERIRSQVADSNVICALSGGVDSAVVAALIDRAIGDRMKAVFVDNGLLRAREVDDIQSMFTDDYPLHITIVDAKKEFLEALQGVTDPEEKRKIIGETFIRIFQAETKDINHADFLAQGTLYPDVIESRSAHGGPSAMIKSHHNVGGLPEDLQFALIEPLKELFKDEVRILGKELGLPEKLLKRKPFPGPGLAVRIIGDVTEESLEVLRHADSVVKEEILKYEHFEDVWQAFAVLLPVKTVGVMGDERTYANVIAIRIVSSLDGMTADWMRLPHDVLTRMSSRIINEVHGVNRVVYDISSKPPSTIEWE